MAKRAGVKHLVLTHLIPPMGAAKQGPYPIPGGGLIEDDYKKAVTDSGFTGNIVVGTDLAIIRLPAKWHWLRLVYRQAALIFAYTGITTTGRAGPSAMHKSTMPEPQQRSPR